MDKQRTYGQYDTPADVADLLLAFCLRRPGDRLLDPGCGRGAFLARAAQMQRWMADHSGQPGPLTGVELDSGAAAEAQALLPHARIINQNFFELGPPDDDLYDAIIGNPPYTRAEWIGRLPAGPEAARQLAIFDPSDEGERPGRDGGSPVKRERAYAVPKGLLGRRAGLHAYFFVHGSLFLREGGRFGFVVPNSWLDVVYGERLKQFLLDRYQILALIESNVERWFEEAKVNVCLIVLEKCSDAGKRATNRVRLVQLRAPLKQLIPFERSDSQRLSQLERLSGRFLPSSGSSNPDYTIMVLPQAELKAGEKWGVHLRAPAVYRRRTAGSQLPPLSSWAAVRRGTTSGANGFFYPDQAAVETWSIEDRFLRPLLKSLRQVPNRQVLPDSSQAQVLFIPRDADLQGTGAAAYIAWGESAGLPQRRTCAGRPVWYALPDQLPPPLLLAKGIWARHFTALAGGELWIDQQIYGLYPADGVPLKAAAALLNSAWMGLQLELGGRVNFGEGVLWLAAYEIESLRLPDPRSFSPTRLAELEQAFDPLLERAVKSIQEEAADPQWLAFNRIVFDLLGMTQAEGAAVVEALLERAAARQTKAAVVNY